MPNSGEPELGGRGSALPPLKRWEENEMEDLTATGGVPGPGRIGRVAIGDS